MEEAGWTRNVVALPIAVLALAALAALAPLVARLFPRAGGALLALPLGASGALVAHAAMGGGQGTSWAAAWLPAAGISLAFRVDGLGLLFALLVTGIGALVVPYAWAYLAGEPERARAVAVLLAFAASMLGLVLADDVVLLYVFWELTSVTSWLLIGLRHERAQARAAAWQALLVTSAGGLALLAGLLLLAEAGGTGRISELAAAAPALAGHPAVPWAAALVVVGVVTKSAQVPVHGWLPRAMEAPTPVSAYLHAATMVKAGVYLALRLSPVLAAAAPFRWGLVAAGGASLLVGAGRALLESDLKRILAYSTVSALGFLLVLAGAGGAAAIHAALAYTLAHALYKGALFLVAGAVDHGAGTRDTDRLEGLRRVQPLTAAAAGLAALSMAGLPGGFGYVAKEAAYGGLLGTGADAVLAVAVLGSALLVVAAALAGWLPFRRGAGAPPAGAHEVGPAMWAPPLALAVAGAALGLAPAGADALLRPAAAALAGGEAEPLALFHGWTTAALSAATVAAGAGLLAARPRLRRALAPGARDRFGALLRGLDRVAKRHTAAVQTGSLPRYLRVTFAVAAVLLAAGLLRAGGPPLRVGAPGGAELLLGALAVAAATAAVRARSRITAIAALGVVGYAVGLLFLLFGAPDLAMTQIAVETVTVMVLLLAFRHLPRFSRISTVRSRARDLAVASAVGGVMALLVLAATAAQAGPKVSEYHAARSVPDAHGHNVVNTTLVDFRALDTLGEATVLATAGFGVIALLKLRPRAEDA
jgi:multicomponent Na+:H+ antiporter subunit A